MTHNNLEYAHMRNKRRVTGPFTKFNFGVVEIDWDARPSPVIAMKAIGVDGSVAFQKTLSLTTLR